MIAITIWQPWASLIAIGAKPFEFRGWPAPRRFWGQRIAIHAGARPVKRAEIAELLAKLEGLLVGETGLLAAPAMTLLGRVWNAPKMLPLSSVVCTAVLGQPIRDAELAAALGVASVNDRDEHSNWGWPLTDVLPVEPIAPARGAQGFWEWKDNR